MGPADLAQTTAQHPPRLLQSRDRRGAHPSFAERAERSGVFHSVGHLPRVPASRTRPKPRAPLPLSPRIAGVDPQKPVDAAGNEAEDRAFRPRARSRAADGVVLGGARARGLAGSRVGVGKRTRTRATTTTACPRTRVTARPPRARVPA